MKTIWHRAKKRCGQGLVEYALILVVIVVAAIVSLSLLGNVSKERYYETFANVFP